MRQVLPYLIHRKTARFFAARHASESVRDDEQCAAHLKNFRLLRKINKDRVLIVFSDTARVGFLGINKMERQGVGFRSLFSRVLVSLVKLFQMEPAFQIRHAVHVKPAVNMVHFMLHHARMKPA